MCLKMAKNLPNELKFRPEILKIYLKSFGIMNNSLIYWAIFGQKSHLAHFLRCDSKTFFQQNHLNALKMPRFG